MSPTHPVSGSHLTEEEIWKDIEGYENLYQVSNFGKVKRLEGTVERYERGKDRPVIQPIKEKILAQTKNTKSGYVTVTLSKDGISKPRTVHVLVANAFLERPEDIVGMVHVCHEDGNPANPHYLNLRFDTPSGNAKDRHAHGTDARGENNLVVIVTEKEVARIKRLLLEADTIKEVANMTGHGYSLVRSISQGVSWAHVEPEKVAT